MTSEVGRRIAYYRQRTDRRMTAQALAEKCSELGLPIGRLVITKLERGIRQSITLAELLVIAKALGVPPLALVAPVGLEEETEILPGRMVPTWDAARWFTGERRGLDDDESATGDSNIVEMFRMHDQLVRNWDSVQESLTWSLEAAAKSDTAAYRDRLTEIAAQARATVKHVEDNLRSARQTMRDIELIPPPLPPRLVHVDEETGDGQG
jgi:transcriptional regulator with XRE-family HTH domain